MRHHGADHLGTLLFQGFLGGDEAAAGVGHVVDDNGIAATQRDVAGDVRDFGHVVFGPTLVVVAVADFGAEHLRVFLCALGTARIRRDDHELFADLGIYRLDMLDEERARLENVEFGSAIHLVEALHLVAMRIERDDTFHFPVHEEHVSDDPGAERGTPSARLVLAVVRDMGEETADGEGVVRCERVDGEHRTHDIFARLESRRSDEVHMRVTHRFLQFRSEFTVREVVPVDRDAPEPVIFHPLEVFHHLVADKVGLGERCDNELFVQVFVFGVHLILQWFGVYLMP